MALGGGPNLRARSVGSRPARTRSTSVLGTLLTTVRSSIRHCQVHRQVPAHNPRSDAPRFTWLGREGSNLRMAESKSAALPLGYAPTTFRQTERCSSTRPKRRHHKTRESPPQAPSGKITRDQKARAARQDHTHSCPKPCRLRARSERPEQSAKTRKPAAPESARDHGPRRSLARRRRFGYSTLRPRISPL